MTDRRIVRIDPSSLQPCDAVMTELQAGGLDPSSLHPDRLVTLVAARQDGVILREQLEALGLGRGAIAHRRRRGLLRPLLPGAFLWGRVDATRWARGRAAMLVSGAGAHVSHEWGLCLWELRAPPVGVVDVTVIGRRVRCAGIRGHESAPLHPADRGVVRGIAVTSPARSLLDSAGRLAPRELADVVERAQVKRLVTKAQILAAIARAPRRPGVPALRALAEDPAFTRSRAERKLVALMRAAQLPEPVFNAYAEGLEVDALWRRERIVLEFDSYGFHATRAALDRDRRRDATLQRARYLVLRTTWTELTRHSHALVARIAEALALSAGAPTAWPARAGP